MALVARSLGLALFAALALPANALAADAIIVKRAPGLDRAERLAVRKDADVTLGRCCTLPNTEVVAPRGDVEEALEALNGTLMSSMPSRTCPFACSPPTHTSASSTGSTTRARGSTGRRASSTPTSTRPRRGPGPGRGRHRRGHRHRRRDSSTPTSPASSPATPASAAAARRPTASTTTTTASSTTGAAGTSSTATTRSRRRTTSTGRTSRARSRRCADNGFGVAGVAPAAKVVPVKVFGAPGTRPRRS